jgi:hypothetical protein
VEKIVKRLTPSQRGWLAEVLDKHRAELAKLERAFLQETGEASPELRGSSVEILRDDSGKLIGFAFEPLPSMLAKDLGSETKATSQSVAEKLAERREAAGLPLLASEPAP